MTKSIIVVIKQAESRQLLEDNTEEIEKLRIEAKITKDALESALEELKKASNSAKVTDFRSLLASLRLSCQDNAYYCLFLSFQDQETLCITIYIWLTKRTGVR